MSELTSRLSAALADRYVIEQRIGEGGMATVYLARDLRHERKVAVKVLRPELTASLGSDRFLREIRIAANLQHPHILPLHDSGQSDGFLYYVMPFVDGESLRDRIARDGELPIADAARILRDVADALSYAHQQGVVHRDIKPDNILLSGRHALVTDFGVAKAVSAATGTDQLTTAGVALGTPSYMSPEQAAADPHIDHRTDIYALGVLAYEMLSGRPPFVGTTPQAVVAAHVSEEPESVTRHRGSVPAHLDSLIMQCLAKKAADRWQTAEELVPQFESLTTPSGGMTPSGIQPTLSTGTRWTRVGLGAALLLVGVGAFVMFGGQNSASASSGPSVGVLPFEMQGATAEDTLLFDALHSEVLTRLYQVQDLRVPAQSSVMRYRGSDRPVTDLADALGVNTVMQTSVRRLGDQFQLSVELVDGTSGQGLWGETWTQSLTAENLFAVQSEIATAIASQLAVELSTDVQSRLEAIPTTSSEAYQAYLSGIAYFRRRFDANDEYRAIELLQQAIAQDPQFADAHAQLARTLVFRFWTTGDTAYAHRAWDAAALADSLAPEGVMTHLALGDVNYYTRVNYELARQHYNQAIAAAPGNAEAIALRGLLARRMGDWNAAFSDLERAIEIDPAAAFIMGQLSYLYGYYENFTEQLALLDRAIAHDPSAEVLYIYKFDALLNLDTARARTLLEEWDPQARFPGPWVADAWWWLAILNRDFATADSIASSLPVGIAFEGAYVAWLAGDTVRQGALARRAIAELVTVTDTSGSRPRFRPQSPGEALMDLAKAYALAGDAEAAMRHAEAAMAIVPPEEDAFEGMLRLEDLVVVRIIVGDHDGALADLAQLRSAPHYLTTTPHLRMDPEYDSIRDDPRFQALLTGWPRPVPGR